MGKELFKNIPSKVGDLVKDVRNGRIGLPDLQRPFVWKDNKVRELFDSMLKGYPIGYIMLWESPSDYESKKSTMFVLLLFVPQMHLNHFWLIMLPKKEYL